MKCHDVLGISEWVPVSDIDTAFSKKKEAIDAQKDHLPQAAYTRKLNEIIVARNECVEWQTKSSTQKISARISEGVTDMCSPNRLNSVSIGCCTACDNECGRECCCEDNQSMCESCCGGSQFCSITCDVVIYLYIGFYLILGIIKVFTWFSESSRQTQYENASRENAQLLPQQVPSADAVREATFRQSVREKRQHDLILFADFFEDIGADSTNELRINEEHRVSQGREEIEGLQRKHDTLMKRIERNNKIIQRGR